jgi:hypothetical protein
LEEEGSVLRRGGQVVRAVLMAACVVRGWGGGGRWRVLVGGGG